jgi:eukaryotic-like serine/threonine-protein kinase
LEKCTETDQKKRFPTIAALRSALFDLWRTSQFDAPIDDDANFLDAVLANPSSVEAWRHLVAHAEGAELTDRNGLLRSLNAEHLVQLSGLDDALFGRLMALICEWVESTGFQWEYCDVIGDRLVEVYRVSPVRIRCHIVLAALDLAVSHNRWHVMNQVGAMLGQTADNGLVDRTLIEIGLDSAIESKLRTIEEIVSWSRDHWHPKIAEHLNAQDKRTSG